MNANTNYYDYACGIILAIFTISLLSNLTLMGVFIRSKNLRKPINVFMLTLIIVNLVITIFYLPFAFINAFFEKNQFGTRLVNFEIFLMYTSNIFIVHLVTAMSCERFWIVHKPVELTKINYRTSIYIVILLALGAMLWAVLPLLGWSHYTLSEFGFTCGLEWNDNKSFDVVSYNVLSILIYFVIPAVVLAFTNGSLIRVHRAKMRLAKRIPGEIPIDIDEARLQKESQYKFLIVLLTTSAIFFSWAPYTLTSMYTAFIRPYGLSKETIMITSLLAKSSIIWFPIIELIFDEDVARGLRFNPRQSYNQEEKSEEENYENTFTREEGEDEEEENEEEREDALKQQVKFDINKKDVNIADLKGPIF